jgi:chromosome segregation ATPase
MSEDHGNDEQELRRLRSEVAAQRRDIHALDDLEHRQEELIARLREEAAVREGDLAAVRERLAAAEHELEDLRAIRDALTCRNRCASPARLSIASSASSAARAGPCGVTSA